MTNRVTAELADQLSNLLGIKFKSITRLVITLDTESIPTVEVTMFADSTSIVEVTQKYEIVPIKGEESHELCTYTG